MTPTPPFAIERDDHPDKPAQLNDFCVRITCLSVLPPKEPLFSEQCTTISIVDEAAGEFLEIKQQGGTIQVSPEEWPALKQAIEQLLADCENQNEKSDR